MPLLPALRAFFTRLLTDVDDALFPQHVFCLTCGALSLPNAICPACLAVLDLSLIHISEPTRRS